MTTQMIKLHFLISWQTYFLTRERRINLKLLNWKHFEKKLDDDDTEYSEMGANCNAPEM